MCVVKRINFHSLDRDPTVAMRFGALNRARHNSALKARAQSNDRWSARPRDRRADFRCASDPTPNLAPCGLQLKHCVGLSPTLKKLRKTVRFIRSGGYEG